MFNEVVEGELTPKQELERKIRETLYVSLNVIRENLQEMTRRQSYNTALDLMNNAAMDEASAIDLPVDMEPAVEQIVESMFEDSIDNALTEVFDEAFSKARTIAASVATTTAAELAFDEALDNELLIAMGERVDIDESAFDQNEFDY